MHAAINLFEISVFVGLVYECTVLLLAVTGYYK